MKKEIKGKLQSTFFYTTLLVIVVGMFYVLFISVSASNTYEEKLDKAEVMLKNAGLQMRNVSLDTDYNTVLLISKATDKSKAIIVVFDYDSGLFMVTYPMRNSKLISLPSEYGIAELANDGESVILYLTAEQLSQLFE